MSIVIIWIGWLISEMVDRYLLQILIFHVIYNNFFLNSTP